MIELNVSDELKARLIQYIRSDNKLVEFKDMCRSGILTEDLLLQLGDVIDYFSNWDAVVDKLGFNSWGIGERTPDLSSKIAISYYMKIDLGWHNAVKGDITFKHMQGMLSSDWDPILNHFLYRNSKDHYNLLKGYKEEDANLLLCSYLKLFNGGASFDYNGSGYNGMFNTIVEFEQAIYDEVLLLLPKIDKNRLNTKGNIDVVFNEFSRSLKVLKRLFIKVSSDLYYEEVSKRWDGIKTQLGYVDTIDINEFYAWFD